MKRQARRRQAAVSNKQQQDKLDELAASYVNYMVFRAAKENLAHELTQTWYRNYLAMGVELFFGVAHNGIRLTNDQQNPAAFAEWLEQK